MDPVHTALLDAVCALFLTETRRIAGQSLRKFVLRSDGVDEFTDHGVLTGTDQVQVLTLDLVHHGVHLSKGHNAGYDIAADHERRDAIGETAVDHEITCIGNHCRMQSCDITHQIVKAVSGYLACCV